jgi:amino acid adenylation domain-containing protein
MSYASNNAKDPSLLQDLCVRQLVKVQSERIPTAVAIAAPGRAPLTYGALWGHMETVAQELRVLGVARHDRVAMVLPQGPELATAFVAICACAITAPLNPGYRASEFEFYLAALHPKALLIQSQVDSPARTVARARGIPIIELSPVLDAAAGIFTLAGTRQRHAVDVGRARSGDVALVLHTSGTTSRPKRVPLTHTNLCASAQNIAATLALTEGDRCLNLMPLFHIHGLVGGTLVSMAAGASLVCPAGFYAPQLLDWLDEFRPTWYTAVPAMHQAILKQARTRRDFETGHPLRLIRSSSAPMPPRVMTELEDLFNVPVIEAYGMTEASHQIASNPLPPQARKPGSVGCATGTELAIIDESGDLLPPGRIGEIVTRGANVMAGYEDDPTGNRDVFTRGWFRTGDQGYRDEDGYFFITGRLKEMINRAGEKISPWEVDDVLLGHPAVTQAVTFAVADPILGEDVAAAVVLHEKGSASEKEIQEFAAERLADFKVPRKIVIIDRIPETPTGKLRRIDLAEKLGVKASGHIDSSARADYEPPRTEMEEKLVSIWSEVLGVDRVGIHDNFYALGGDSILAAQIIARLRERMNVDLSFLGFFKKATIAGLVEGLKDSARLLPPQAPPPALGQTDKRIPLSCAQERLWFLEQVRPGGAAYNRPTFFRFTGRLNVAALEQSLDEIFRRHEILRTTFSSIDGDPFQVISSHRTLHLARVDLGALSKTARDTEAGRLAAEEAERPFDLVRGPLFRVTLLRLAADEHLLLLTFHHIVFDGWSEGVLLRELLALYGALCAGRPSPLRNLAMQYADFAFWQRQWLKGEMPAVHAAYWRTQLKGTPDLIALPTDRPRPSVQTFRTGREPVRLSAALTKTLKTLSLESKVSLFMTLTAAFQVLLSRASGQTDVSIGTFNANRAWVETEGLIGFFVNNLVLRTHLSGDPSFRQVLRQVREVCLGAYAHRELPFEKVLEELHPKRSSSHTPLFQVMLVLQNAPMPSSQLPGLTIERYPTMEHRRSAFDLTLELEEAETLTGHLHYNTDLFDAATIRRMVSRFQSLLENVAADPDLRVLSQPPLSGNERSVHEKRSQPAPIVASLQTDQKAARESRLAHHSDLPRQTRVDDTSVRKLDLAQRRARLSSAKQAVLAKRLHGDLAVSSEDTIVTQPQLRHSGSSTFTLGATNADRHSAPLSFAQQRLWFLDQYEPDKPFYNIPFGLRLSGPLNVAALDHSLSEIIRRHEVLRTTFTMLDGEPVQSIAAPVSRSLPMVDLSDRPVSEREAEARRFVNEEAQRPFDLAQGPLFRTALIRLGEEDHVLLLTLHHIISDGWSTAVLYRELSVLYEAFSRSQPSPLSELPIQYADYAVWQRQWLQGEVLESQLSYWKRQLEGAPAVLDLPTDRPRPAVQTYRGARSFIELSKELTEGLKALSRKEGITLFMTLLAAFQTLLYRYTGQDDIVVGSPIANRNRTEIEGLIGFFVNTLVLRTDLSGNPTFRDLLHRVRKMSLEAYDHQDLPFEKLVEELNPERDLNHSPLFQVLFALQNAPASPRELSGVVSTPIKLENDTTKFDLSLSMIERSDGLRGSWEYSTDLFDEATIVRINGHFCRLLEGIVANPDQSVFNLPILTEPEKHELLTELNDTKREYPKDKCLHQLFEEQAARTPDAVAVVFEEQQLTYQELNCRANQLAHHLQELGVRPEVLVGICLERSLNMVIGVLGILKAGGAYVPLDPTYPQERLAFILEDTQAAVLLTQERLVESLPEHGARVVCLDADWEVIAQESRENPLSPVKANNRAYVIYTSGSTGKPKGVQVPHRGVVNLLYFVREQPGLTAKDTLLSVTTLSFDVVVSEIFLPLSVGARLEVVSHEVASDGTRLLAALMTSGATFLHPTPATWRLLLEAGWEGSKQLTMISTGEALSRELANKLLPRGAALWNLYGPTEITIWSAAYRVDSDAGPILIGRPVANTQLYILDSHLQPVPIGVVGELYVGGDGVTRGYLNRPELTSEKFTANPFSKDPGSRLYKTGDLARYLPDGNIECLGRIDHQVKLRGFRIELEEIETVLSQHPAVRETVVVAREEIPGDKRLVAYLVVDAAQPPSGGDLRGFLKQQLPDYMIPSVFVSLSALPLTPNGKIDRLALPAPDQNRSELEVSYVAPRDAIEVQLTRIWEKVLGRHGPIGGRDNFFALGGHSLLAVQVVHQIREVFGQTVPVKALFQAPTVEQLAEVLREEDPLRDWASLVPLQPNGSKPPFFFLAGRSHFGDRLGPDQPVYRVVYQDLDREQLFVRIEDMASHSIESVKKIQPDGPYYLGGHAVGGMVAFEMAQQLRRQGQKVALLALCECWTRYSGPPRRSKSGAYRLWQKANYHFHQTQRVGAREEFTHLLVSLKNKTWGSAGRRQSVPLSPAQEGARAAAFEAMRRYVPQAYSGRITLIRSSERRVWRDHVPLDGWGSLAKDGVEVYEVPGRHAEIYREPNVGMLAQRLSDVLHKAQAEMENERTALIDHNLPLTDSRLFGDTQSGRTENKNHRHSFSESLGGDS